MKIDTEIDVDACVAHAFPSANLALDEESAVTLAILIRNHIEALQVWERKVCKPYMPTTRGHLSLTPEYPKPTQQTMTHIAQSGVAFAMNVIEARKVIERRGK